MDNRIVITGAGICCAVGNNVSELLDSLRAARSGLRPYECEKAPNLHTRFAGIIDSLPNLFDQQLMTRWDRGTLLAAHAAREALIASKIQLHDLPGHRVGLATGASGSGQFNPAEDNPLKLSRIDELTAKIVMHHNTPCFQTNELASYFQIHGPTVTVSSASAGSGIAIGLAMRWLQTGQADFVLAGGGEGLLPLNIIGFDLLGLLDSQPCSPFSRSEGMSMGEGAGFVTLERYDTAIARGAHILAQLHGFGVTSDAFDAIQFDPSGDGIRRALDTALRDSGLTPDQVDWIRASGAGGASQDASEIAAIKSAFGQHLPIVSSTESTTGHTNGAGPAIGLVTCVTCQQAELLPATLNFDQEQSAHELDIVATQPRAQAIDNFVSTTAAFGGTNVVLVGGKLRPSRTEALSDSIVISGVGLVTPVGCGTRELATQLLQETCSWNDVNELGEFPSQIRNIGLVKDFQPRKLLSSLRMRGVDRITQFAAAATKLALQDAQINAAQMSERIGIVSAIARPSGEALGKLFDALQQSWATLTVSKALLRKGRFLVASQLANWFGCKAFNATITDGLGAGLGALIAAANQLKHSPQLDAVVVVAADEISCVGLRMWEALNCMSKDRAENWTPYDNQSGGMIASEGAVAFIVQRASDVQARSCPLAEIAGMAQTNDAVAGSQTESALAWMQADPSGKWLAEAAQLALSNSGCVPSDISMVIGNGCGVAAYDERELRALRTVFGQALPLESVNRHVGVLESSCGLLGIAAAASHIHNSAMREKTSHTPCVGLADAEAAMVCASSEMGRNTCLVLRSTNS